ncbi:MAG: DUF2461 domain-containing protein [Flavobacteriales bacterium]|nr:DUF2461 domain-containing protein [Flavobacteriales bacterium]MBK6752393.1 DUF2461 domain-containing protein [Flavobacteriales bacterium]MBK7084735.1 DUF2461 domain-containing protein [Flavobacteriales bacterium]MBK7752156.1 DUF2461 domain-containing protein [Flavobacteriales bacterium]MBK9074364.1 DUF2461 domain-containing protein [Flavobacteriales bacterium]
MAWFTNDFNGFFKDLAKNNNKEWFDANRKRYEESVKKPFEAFTSEVIKRIAKHDKTITIGPKEAIFRINKDIRFSKDKTPYKLNTSAIISPAGRKDHATPGIYFELGPESVKFYGGAYQPEKDQLEKIRTAILRDGKGFRKAIEGKAFTTLFGTVKGEVNKVLAPEFKAMMAKEPLIANKQFYVGAELPAKLVADAKLMEVLMDHYQAMCPFNAWLAAAMRK